MVATPAAAQGLRISQATTVALQLADAETTRQGLRMGFQEGNPLMTAIVRRPATLYAFKVGVATGEVWMVHRLATTGHRRAAWVMSLGLNVGQAIVVARNVALVRHR